MNKVIGVLNYLLFVFPFIKKGRFLNMVHVQSSFQKKSKITIGYRNIFKRQSKIHSDPESEFIKIGDRNYFDFNALIKSHHGYLSIGNGNYIGPNCILQGFGGLTIGNGVMIAGNTFISSSNHDFSNPLDEDYLQKEIGKETTIEDKVWIGANCVITAGVNIGKSAIIGAGSVITKDVLPYSMVVGSPGELIKNYDFTLKRWIKI
jgi:acetyltransferase-like isoleucine patch superfamily enzyme